MNNFSHSILRAATVAALSLVAQINVSANEATYWNRVAVATTSRAMPDDPLSESRILAVVHTAMHDAANAVEPRFRTFAKSLNTGQGGSVEAAIATAAHLTLRELVSSSSAYLDDEYDRRLSLLPEGESKVRGIAAGEAAAAALLQQRRADGADKHIETIAGTRAGQYRPTPPEMSPALMGHWGRLRPFVLSSAEQFRPKPPLPVGSQLAKQETEAVRAMGGVQSTRRSHEQSEIACYWYEDSTRSWNRIARDVGTAQNLDTWEQARLLALVNLALADGFIAGFEAKYHYYTWRPITAVREGGDDTWLSYLPNPPVPDYPSTHTVLGAAAATVLAQVFGSDLVSFSMTSGHPYPNITRRFWSFSQAARENGASRVFAGIHFPSAVEAGYEQGAAIGQWTFQHALQRLEPSPTLAATR
jgi:membrane-associated phospholipid phosphatase